MKSIQLQTVLVSLVLITTIGSQAQMVTKTNEIHIDLQQEAARYGTGALPTIEWKEPLVEFTSSKQGNIHISLHLQFPTPVKQAVLKVVDDRDGSLIATTPFRYKAEDKEVNIELNLHLPDGRNRLSAEVTTQQGVVVSATRVVAIGKAALENMVALNRHDYALVFATDKYDNWNDLVNPVADAHAIADVLKETYGFQVEVVENPSIEMVWQKLRDYSERKFEPQDQLIVFFAGHGHFDEAFGEGYVVARNSLKNDVSRVTYISHNRLRGIVNNIPCPHILLTMDVCFGGTLDPVIASSRGQAEAEVTVSDMLVRKWNHKTRKYLTSGGKEYVSDGKAGTHSPFATRLLEALKSRGGEDEVLTLSEIQSSLERLAQLPRMGSFGSDEAMSDFVFIARH